MNYQSIWQTAWAQETEGADPSQWRVTKSSQTKGNPDGEDYKWWFENGSQMLESWIAWRKAVGWEIWRAPDGRPAIELDFNIQIAGVPTKMSIDRVFVRPDGDLVILDLKTGKRTPNSDLQLAVYAAGIDLVYGVRPKWGAYWMARKAGTENITDLDTYPTHQVEKLIAGFDKARKSGVFLPNHGHCHMCSAREFCEWYPSADATKKIPIYIEEKKK